MRVKYYLTLLLACAGCSGCLHASKPLPEDGEPVRVTYKPGARDAKALTCVPDGDNPWICESYAKTLAPVLARMSDDQVADLLELRAAIRDEEKLGPDQ